MHNPVADKECWIVLIEPVGTKHTGDATTDRTRSIDEQLRCPSLFSTKRKQTETPTFFISSKVKPSFPSFSADHVSSTTGALVHGCGTERMGIFETADYGVAALRRTAFGRAQASMRLRTAQPMATSVC
jgi:hypothetical protein